MSASGADGSIAVAGRGAGDDAGAEAGAAVPCCAAEGSAANMAIRPVAPITPPRASIRLALRPCGESGNAAGGSVHRARGGVGRKPADQPFHLPPATEMHHVARYPAAIGAYRRFVGGKGTEAAHQCGRVRHHVTVGKVKV